MSDESTETITAPVATETPASTSPGINSLGDAIAAGLAKASSASVGKKPTSTSKPSTTPPVKDVDATPEPPSDDTDSPPTSPVVASDSSPTPELPEAPNDEPAQDEPAVDSTAVDDRYRELESRFIEAEPKTQAYDSIANFLQESRVSNEDFQAAMLALKARAEGNYTEFQKLVTPWLDEVKSFTGDALPPELAKLVEAGECTPEVAKRLAAAEAQRVAVAKNAQRASEQAAKAAEQAHLAGMMRSFGDWLSVRQKTDTSFKPKAGPNARDGAYEYFLLKLNAEVPKAGIRDAKSLAALADRVYQEASAMFSKQAPNGAAKVLRGSAASTGGRAEPKSLAEAIRMGVAQAGKRPPTL